MLKLIGTVLFFILVGCGSKDEAYRESNNDYCKNNKIENEFIAHWRDVKPSIVLTADVLAFIEKYRGRLLFVEPNYRLRLDQQMRTVRLDRPMSAYKILNEIGALAAWRRGYHGQNKLIAVIDSGIEIRHGKLRDTIFLNAADANSDGEDDDNNGFIDDRNGWNFASNSNQIVDEIGHGTSIAGIISGKNMSGESLGIAPAAKILPIDIMTGASGSEFDAKRAVEYAIQMKAHIVNNSWTITCSHHLASSFKSHEADNVIFVNSAGNLPIDVLENQVMPSSLDLANFLNVGSTSLYGRLSRFSGFGRTINIWAPGEQVPVLALGSISSSESKASGTSVSAAIISGAAAVVWSAHPTESAREIVVRLRKGASSIGDRNFISIERSL